ncbi:MAG: alpha/beta fold hydrolase [Nocardioides sp.]
MPTFSVSGAELDFEISDEGGPAVVQLHGLTSSRHRDRLLDLDLGRGLSGTRLLRYDARGHGRSSGSMVPADYGWDRLADDLLQLLEHVFPGERAHGVGPSMGTGTLLHAITRAPERFSALTLVVPPTAWESRVAKAVDYRAARQLVESRGMPAFVEAGRLATRPPATVEAPETVPDVTEALLPTLLEGAAMTDFPSREAVAGIAVPTLVLAWVEDPAHPVSTAAGITALVPGSRMVIAETPADVSTWPGLLHRQVTEVHG